METAKRKRRGHRRNTEINWKIKFKMAIKTYLSIITLDVNRLDTSIKRHKVADWLKTGAHNILSTRNPL